MPLGTGAVSERNLPNAPYEVNPALFAGLTQRQVFNPTQVTMAAPGSYVTTTLRQVGIVGKLTLLIQGSIVTAAASTFNGLTFKFPYGLLKNVSLSGNQMNNFISASGYDLYLRRLMQYRALVEGYATFATANIPASTTSTFAIPIEIPVAMDMTTLVGALYAQSEATNLALVFTSEALANLGTVTGTVTENNTAGAANTSPTISIAEEIFSVPYHPNKPGTLVIPDLTVLHGLISNDNPVASQTTVTTELYRANANLERLYFYVDNNNALVVTANFAAFDLTYGAKEIPYSWNPPDLLRIRNNTEYRQILPDGTYCIDFVAENPQRDQVILEGVTNLRLDTQFASAFTPNAAAKVHWVQETLFA